jgi:hypothetical protein
MYRGAFLLNYLLASVAVALAAASLALLGAIAHVAPVEQAQALRQAVEHATADAHGASDSPSWLLPTLLILASIKLALLFAIARNTRRANREAWNDYAVDYRYLAERLRGMQYLPLAGSHQPPAAAPPQFASRVVRQSAVDWLFDALVRSISPAEMPQARSTEIPSYDESGVVRVQRLLSCNSREVIAAVRTGWIEGQARYHERNANTMRALHRWAERTGEHLGRGVIVIVAIDLLLVSGEWLHALPGTLMPWVAMATPWLIFVSAVLPAVVASLNGIRFQSECERLAERSAVMRVMLEGRDRARPEEPRGRRQHAEELERKIAAAQADPGADPGGWSYDVLRLTELVATDFVQEVAEWSVLYAKEVSDPG